MRKQEQGESLIEKKLSLYIEETLKKSNIFFLNISEELKDENLSQEYLLSKAQLYPVIVRMGYELCGGKNWKEEAIPACTAVQLRGFAYRSMQEFFNTAESDKNLFYQYGTFHMLSQRALLDGYDYLWNHYLISKELTELDEEQMKAFQFPSKGIIYFPFQNGKLGDYYQDVYRSAFWHRSLVIGGIPANASHKKIDELRLVGTHLSTSFLVARDIEDMGGELIDFKKGRPTLPIVNLFQMAEPIKKDYMKEWFGKGNLSEEQIAFIRNEFVRSQAFKMSLDYLSIPQKAAMENLRNFFPKSEVRDFIDYLLGEITHSEYYDVLRALEK